jgi:glycosyltransferase involved in cell wall biosynthesis
VAVHPHPVYHHLPPSDHVLPRRARLELLFFGFVRPYKGLDVLVDALARIPEQDWHLTVAGEPWKRQGHLRQKANEAGVADRIDWIERYIPSAEATALFDRADAVVLPYRRATGCGVLALALGTGTPAVASDLPGLREQVIEGESGWLVPPRDAAALARRLATLDPDELRRIGASIRDRSHRWTWDSLAATTLGHAP